MNRKLLLLALLASGSLWGQTLVSTSPQNKKVVLEEFTGINCVFCPDGHAIAQGIKDENPDDVFLINVHTGGFANPGNGQPDFRTDFGTALERQSGLTGYPAGTINRHVFVGNTTALNRGQWESAAKQILQQSSYVNIAGKAEIDIQANELIVDIEVYYTGDSPENTNKLNVALLQDNTLGPQTGGNMGNNYNHMHRLVHFITGQWGEDITKTSEGDLSEFSFTYPLPDNYRDIPVELDDLKLIAYVAEGNQEILTGDEIIPAFTNIAENDVALVNIEEITPTCLGRITPIVTIQNIGSNDLNSLEITYSVNEENEQTFTWTGDLEFLEKEVVTLDEIVFDTDAEEFLLEVQIAEDDNSSNNNMSSEFLQSIEGSENIVIRVTTSTSGPTTTWEIINLEGDVVASGGPYENQTNTTHEINLPENCYEFIITDTAGEGTGLVRVRDEHNVELFKVPINYGDSFSGNFRTSTLLEVEDVKMDNIALYPNPTTGVLNITNAEGAQLVVYNMLGQIIVSKDRINHQEIIDLSNLTSGVYYVQLQNGSETKVKKVIVK